MTSKWLAMSLAGLSLLLLSACAVAEDPAANRQISDDQERPAGQLLDDRDDPQPVVLPDDSAPHDRLTEWWYYTGHIEDEDGRQYGFQFVIFQILRGDFPALFAAHFAVTDTDADTFTYEERTDSLAYEPGELPINFTVDDWQLRGEDGVDHISASAGNFELDIDLEAVKDPVLHEDVGFFEFAPGAESYYYSRTRMTADGVLSVDGDERHVSGEAWFDQQWGDFLVLDNIGWDWFSVQLDNDEEFMAWQSHDTQGSTLDANATIVLQDGSVIDVPAEDVQISNVDNWQSPSTDAVYPMGWVIEVASHDIRLEIDPVMEDQELITLDSTGVIYWEGMVSVTGLWSGEDVEGLGYVELTGYAEPPDE